MSKLNINKDRQKRLEKTGKWFEEGLKTKTNIWFEIILPILLITSLIFTVYIAIN